MEIDKIILEACEEIKETIHEAKEHVRFAIVYKLSYPSLASCYVEMANEELNRVDRLLEVARNLVSKSETIKDTWDYEFKYILKKLDKARFVASMYQKY